MYDRVCLGDHVVDFLPRRFHLLTLIFIEINLHLLKFSGRPLKGIFFWSMEENYFFEKFLRWAPIDSN